MENSVELELMSKKQEEIEESFRKFVAAAGENGNSSFTEKQMKEIIEQVSARVGGNK